MRASIVRFIVLAARGFMARLLFLAFASLVAAKPMWQRLPMPSVSLGPDGPDEYWSKKEASSFLSHNIITEPYNGAFRKGAGGLVINDRMRAKYSNMTNGERRTAIVQLLAALNNWVSEHTYSFASTGQHGLEYWLEGGTLIAAEKRGGKFIPWDLDADVTFLDKSWQTAQAILNTTQHSGQDKLPLPAGQPCGVILLDTHSFGSRRAGTSGWEGIPGRLIHECTGNYMDIFVGIQRQWKGQKMIELSQRRFGTSASFVWEWARRTIYPLRPCTMEGYVFLCPNDAAAYLAKYYKDSGTPDHKWLATRHDYVRTSASVVSQVTALAQLVHHVHLQQLHGANIGRRVPLRRLVKRTLKTALPTTRLNIDDLPSLLRIMRSVTPTTQSLAQLAQAGQSAGLSPLSASLPHDLPTMPSDHAKLAAAAAAVVSGSGTGDKPPDSASGFIAAHTFNADTDAEVQSAAAQERAQSEPKASQQKLHLSMPQAINEFPKAKAKFESHEKKLAEHVAQAAVKAIGNNTDDTPAIAAAQGHSPSHHAKLIGTDAESLHPKLATKTSKPGAKKLAGTKLKLPTMPSDHAKLAAAAAAAVSGSGTGDKPPDSASGFIAAHTFNADTDAEVQWQLSGHSIAERAGGGGGGDAKAKSSTGAGADEEGAKVSKLLDQARQERAVSSSNVELLH